MSNEELSKIEEYKRKLEQYEAEQTEKAKVFDPKEILRSAKEPRSIIDEVLGEVKFGVLTLGELLELNKVDEQEKSVVMLWMMLKKAHPDLAIEDVKALPIDVSTRLFQILPSQGFLSQPSKTGSESAPSPRTSAS